MGWEQIFQHRQRSSACFTTYLTGATLLTGVIALLVKPLIGILALLLGLAFSAYLRYFGTTLTIICTAEGFTVIRESRRAGKAQKEYRWEQVTATHYRESAYHSNSRRQRIGYFSLSAGAERAFEVDDQMPGFGRLIELCNDMTQHLPYVWRESAALPFTGGAVIVNRDRYEQVPRQAANQAA